MESNSAKKINNTSTSIKWNEITSVSDLNKMLALSNKKTIAIFKHSTRCSISALARGQFEKNWNYSSDDVIPVYLNVIANKDLSDIVESQLSVKHASPQLIVIKNEKIMSHTSHKTINVKSIADHI